MEGATSTRRGPRLLGRRPGAARGTGRPGQSVIEFALLLPILLGLLLGLIDTGMLLATKNSLDYADRQATRLMEAFGASAGTNPDPMILQALLDALRASNVNLNGLHGVTFYRADTAALARQGDNPAEDLVYPWSTSAMTFTAPTSSAATPYTYTIRSPGDYVGVAVNYTYTGFTPLFAGGITLDEVTNTQIDPASGSFSLPTTVPTPTLPPAATYTPPPTLTPPSTYTPWPTYTQPPTATPTNTATPTATSTSTLTPTATATSTPVAGSLVGSVTTAVSSTVNLTAEGTADWVHWGLSGASSYDNKNGAGLINPVLTHVPGIGGPGSYGTYASYPVTFTWSDGTPPTTTASTNTGVVVQGPGSNSTGDGFSFTVPATTMPRTLRVYVGVYGAKGQLTATLSDGSASPYVDSSLNDPSPGTTGSKNAVYTITYNAASSSQTLTVKWIIMTDNCAGGTCTGGSPGSANIKAATLQ